jgi:hypothetical protein
MSKWKLFLNKLEHKHPWRIGQAKRHGRKNQHKNKDKIMCFNLAEEKLNCIENFVLELKFAHLCH